MRLSPFLWGPNICASIILLYSLRAIVFGGTVIYIPPQVVTFLYNYYIRKMRR